MQNAPKINQTIIAIIITNLENETSINVITQEGGRQSG
jgi:hypothetical protein